MLPEFLFAVNNRVEGAGFVLQTIPPYLVAKVYKIRPGDVDNFRDLLTNNFNKNIPGYSIFLVYECCLTDQFKTDTQQTINILHLMAKFYYHDKIENKKAEFKRYQD